MKKTIALMLTAMLCCTVLAGCGKSTPSPYLPYSETLRLDTPKDELIEAEGLIINEATSTEYYTDYTKPTFVTVNKREFKTIFQFTEDTLTYFSCSMNLPDEDAEKEYQQMVKYISKLYGSNTEGESSEEQGVAPHKETKWVFTIDTGAKYEVYVLFYPATEATGEANIGIAMGLSKS